MKVKSDAAKKKCFDWDTNAGLSLVFTAQCIFSSSLTKKKERKGRNLRFQKHPMLSFIGKLSAGHAYYLSPDCSQFSIPH